MNVLLVDDDPEIRLLVGWLLRDAGHDVVEAADSASARSAAQIRVPDLVLMDVMLGEEDGIDTARALFPADSSHRAQLVFLTASTEPAQLERMRAAGGAGILRKPFDPAGLMQQLGAILDSVP